MGEVCWGDRKRVLTDVTGQSLFNSKFARMAATDAVPAAPPSKAVPDAPADSHVAGSMKPIDPQTTQQHKLQQQQQHPEQPPATPPKVVTVAEAAAETPSPELAGPPTPTQQDHRSTAHLLLKACEREEAAEDRADTAESALKETKAQLSAAESRAEEAESRLQDALERIKLLELQSMHRAINGGNSAASKMSEGTGSEQAASELQAASEPDAERGSVDSDHLAELQEDWPTRVATWDAAAEEAEVVQLRLELEETAARLTMSREAEENAKRYAEAAGDRLDVLSAMLRGAADVAFAGSDTSARRLRHHLFRCLDVDCDGFLGGHDLQHWYRTSEQFLDTQGYDPVTFEALQAQLADALYSPTVPEEFKCKGKVSLLELSRSKMGGGIVAVLLNLDNLMQDRNTSEWGAARPVSLS